MFVSYVKSPFSKHVSRQISVLKDVSRQISVPSKEDKLDSSRRGSAVYQ